MKTLLGCGLVVGLGLVLFLVLWPGSERPLPVPAPQAEKESASGLFETDPIAARPSSSDDFTRPAPAEPHDPGQRERQEKMALDPARIEVAERALGSFEVLFLDSTALERVEPGEIRGGMLPQALSHRRIALAAIDTVISHPENAGEIRARSLRVLEALVQQPWPAVATAEADQFVLEERGHALATLVRADPGVAAEAYRGIPESTDRERVANRAVHLLAKGGMAKEEARAQVSRLAAQ